MDRNSECRNEFVLLQVDSSLGDRRLFEEGMKAVNAVVKIHSVTDGEKALSFIRGEAGYEECPVPHLIVTDIKLPKMTGLELVKELKTDESLRSIPVVVFSSSEDLQHVTESYLLNANCYISKPTDLNHYISKVKSIYDFWANTAQHPKMSNPGPSLSLFEGPQA